MKNAKVLYVFLIAVLVTCAAGCASFGKTAESKQPPEVTRKTESDGQGNLTMIFYRDGKEIARQQRRLQNVVSTTGTIPDGIVKEYNKNGQLFLALSYKNNCLDGVSKMYYKNGVLKAEKDFKNNMRDGVIKEYYQNGQLRGEATFKNDKAQGVAKSYFENGTLKEEANFVDSKLDGVSKAYHNSGTLLYEYTYKNGTLISTVEYDQNGKVIKKKKGGAAPPYAIPGGEDHGSF